METHELLQNMRKELIAHFNERVTITGITHRVRTGGSSITVERSSENTTGRVETDDKWDVYANLGCKLLVDASYADAMNFAHDEVARMEADRLFSGSF